MTARTVNAIGWDSPWEYQAKRPVPHGEWVVIRCACGRGSVTLHPDHHSEINAGAKPAPRCIGCLVEETQR